MHIHIKMKKLGSKNELGRRTIELSKKPTTLQSLLEEIVVIEVESYNNKQVHAPILPFLLNKEIEWQSQAGKIGFQTRYNDMNIGVDKAIDVCLQAFRDGLVKVFINDQEIMDLASDIRLKENSELVFVKLTMLSGRMW